MIFKRIIAFFFFLLPVCSVLAQSSFPLENSCVHQCFQIPPFSSIQALGDVDIQIDTSSHKYEVTISGRLKNTQTIKFEVRNSTLWINPLAQNPLLGRPKIKICMPMLLRLIYTGGCANITVNCIRLLCPLSLDIHGSPKINICGNIIPGEIVIGGGTQLLMYWINGGDFCLKATDDARVCVAGSVHTFAADSFDSSWINAKYLRTTRAFVKSHDRSRVDLRPSCSLSTLASQNSVIYYYQHPYMQTPFVQKAGSVIPMSPICYPSCKDCDAACSKNSWH